MSSSYHRNTACSSQPTCNAGQKLSADSKVAKRVCSACDELSYQTKTGHRETKCIAQAACGKGTRWVGSVSTKRSCTNCIVSKEEFHDSDGHYDAACKKAAKCSASLDEFQSKALTRTTDRVCTSARACDYKKQFESKAPTSTTNRECSTISVCNSGSYVSKTHTMTSNLACKACATNTYQSAKDHRITKCEKQPTCGAGDYITADSKVKQRKCMPCADNTYLGETNHRTTDCTAQPVCKSGEKMTADTKKARRVCSTCEPNKYQEQSEHRITTCESQPLCGPGEYITADSKTSARSCVRCPDEQYREIFRTNHREATCKQQTQCNPGEFISPYSPIRAQTCSTCSPGQFQTANKHREEVCEEQVRCSPGSRFSDPASANGYFGKPTEPGDCVKCEDDDGYVYQDAINHRSRRCEEQPTCELGTFFNQSIVEERTCEECPEGMYQPDDDHFDDACLRYRVLSCGVNEYMEVFKSKTSDQTCS